MTKLIQIFGFSWVGLVLRKITVWVQTKLLPNKPNSWDRPSGSKLGSSRVKLDLDIKKNQVKLVRFNWSQYLRMCTFKLCLKLHNWKKLLLSSHTSCYVDLGKVNPKANHLIPVLKLITESHNSQKQYIMICCFC